MSAEANSARSTDLAGTRAVIIGGGGFIGTHLANDLVLRGAEEVVCADLRDPRRPVAGARYVRCDVQQPLTHQVPGDFDLCYNLAAVHTTPGHPDHEYYDTNIFGAMNVLDFCSDREIDTLVFTSTMAVYGPSEEKKTEESVPTPVSAYGKSKLQAEYLHQQWANIDSQRRLVIVRPAVIFGTGEGGNYTRLANALKRGVFFYPGRRDTIKSSGYVKDLVDSIDFALRRANPIYLYNFCFPDLYTIQDICDTFAAVSLVRRPLGTVPIGILKTAALPFELADKLGIENGICGERIDKLVLSTAIVPKRLIEDSYPFPYTLANALRSWLKSDVDITIDLLPEE